METTITPREGAVHAVYTATSEQTRTVTRFAWAPTFVDDARSRFALAWLRPIRVTERYGEPPARPELYGDDLFFPEARWRRVRVERA